MKNGITLIKKANHLIEARYKFDIWETRFFMSVLAQIHKNDKDFQVYRIFYQDIIKMFDLSSHQSYNFLREGANSLMGKRLYIPDTNTPQGVVRETQYHLIRSINYLKEVNELNEEIFLENQEFIDVTVDPDMKPLLLQLRDQGGFTFYELKNVIKLGVYAVRIYELLKQYQKIGQRKMYIAKLMSLFELTTEYPRFANFYQKVIAPSVREINKHTDLHVNEPQKLKEGRKVVALLFIFRKKDGTPVEVKQIIETAFETIATTPQSTVIKETPIVVEPVKTPDLHETLYTEFEPDVVKGFGVTPFVLLQLLQNYDADLIRKQIRITKRKRGASPTTNIAGFFVDAVKTDYNDPDEAKEAKKQAKIAQIAQLEQAKKEAKQKKELQEEYEEILGMVTTSRNNTIRKLVANDPTLTPRAIEYATACIQSNAALLNTFEQSRYDFTALTLDDWRQEEFLRHHVIEAIQQLEPKSFLYLSSLVERLEELEGLGEAF